MNNVQNDKIAELNDSYGVARWKMEGATLFILMDDGDEAEVDRYGNVTWRSVSGGDSKFKEA